TVSDEDTRDFGASAKFVLEINGLEMSGLDINGLAMPVLEMSGLEMRGLEISGLEIKGLEMSGVEIRLWSLVMFEITSSTAKVVTLQFVSKNGVLYTRSTIN